MTHSKTKKLSTIGGWLIALSVAFYPAVLVQAEHHTNVHEIAVCAPTGIALGGYDAVSYHSASKPSPGRAEYQAQIGDLTYQFTTADNLATFQADPDRYLPSYLGWCSTNLSMGRLACPDYTNFKIENGKLLLFEHAGFTNGRDVWNSDPTLHRQQADQNFLKFSR
ncbi:MAG: YHS domain-containing (seleno)protein [Pseudomonadota bacterium]